MAIFRLGPIIRERREELGLTQEDLADGICSTPTLSRIENGERMPTKNHFEMLMQRLGYSAMSLDFFTDKHDFLIHELKFKTRQSYVAKDYVCARRYLREIEKNITDPTQIDKQFLLLYKVLLYEECYTTNEKRNQFENALSLTCPSYGDNRVPHVLSYEEIILLNNIAICYDVGGEGERAISILYTLKEYYEHHVISLEEALRTQPMILYNLSKVLGLRGQYDECIEVCDIGIRLAKKSGRCPMLGETLFNRAWVLLKRCQPGDREAAKEALKQAYYFSDIMGEQEQAKIIHEFYVESFAESFLV